MAQYLRIVPGFNSPKHLHDPYYFGSYSSFDELQKDMEAGKFFDHETQILEVLENGEGTKDVTVAAAEYMARNVEDFDTESEDFDYIFNEFVQQHAGWLAQDIWDEQEAEGAGYEDRF